MVISMTRSLCEKASAKAATARATAQQRFFLTAPLQHLTNINTVSRISPDATIQLSAHRRQLHAS
jgi:hypothetical protein